MQDANDPDAPQPYVKSLEDELDWKLFDQLNGVVAQMSNFCFEIKKFCVTTEFVVLTLLAKFTADRLDHAIFVTGLFIPVSFWFLDAVAYFYQVSIRGTMDTIQRRLVDRNKRVTVITSSYIPVISETRINQSPNVRVFHAAFNHSMWIYALLIGTDVILWTLFGRGVLR